MPITPTNPFKGRHFPGDRDLPLRALVSAVSAGLPSRGRIIGRARGGSGPRSIWRWVQVYGPELDRRYRQHLKRTNKSYRVDETYIKVKGEDPYLHRAVDSCGQTVDFLLTAKRDAAGAKRFFRKALSAPGNCVPRVINGDKNPAYPAAVESLQTEGCRGGSDCVRASTSTTWWSRIIAR